MEEYLAKKLTPLKSYPTYQLHAFTASQKLPADTVFNICVLQTLKWLRSRLARFDKIPEELMAPEPEDYAGFSSEQLRSFNINTGAAMDCTYIPGRGVWSFRISEPDAGESGDAASGRAPIIGRVFQTEVTFLRWKENVEVGVRTVCSEPSDCDAPCSVFRPAVVRELANDPDVGLAAEGFRLDGKPMMITDKGSVRELERLIESREFSMPVVLVADSGYEKAERPVIAPEPGKLSLTGFDSFSLTGGLTADLSKVSIKSSLTSPEARPQSEAPAKQRPRPVKAEKEKLPVIDYELLAAKTMCFSVVCFVGESCFGALKNKLGISLSEGEILVISGGHETERLRYLDADMEQLGLRLKTELRNMLKRLPFRYGDVLFYSDARLADLRERRHESLSLEDKLASYKQENTELSESNRELAQQNNDLRQKIESDRTLRRQIRDLTGENEGLKVYISSLKNEYGSKEEAYKRAAELVSFYRQKAYDAAEFPTDKNSICGWVKKSFPERIYIAPQAETALRKYGGGLDTAILCDGIYYLDAYARYRRGEICGEELALYGESYSWEAAGCGSGALRLRRDDYEIEADGRRYLLDMHIKYGVSAKLLIRIYFCWDEEERRVVIGHMPDHLPTAAQST
ncbi:MAG: hypothetical protein IJ071_12915 [Ruminococcus sp.]|nr:hypothetical protein [Ruminococcus sp.]